MHPFPHRYDVDSSATPDSGDIAIRSTGLLPLVTATPIEFDGPGDRWSPETLLVAAVADCFVLTFRGIARASRLAWTSIDCDVAGTLDRVERVTRFTEFVVRARVVIPDAEHLEQARRIVVRAEETCLITRSLNGATRLDATVEVCPPELQNRSAPEPQNSSTTSTTARTVAVSASSRSL